MQKHIAVVGPNCNIKSDNHEGRHQWRHRHIWQNYIMK